MGFVFASFCLFVPFFFQYFCFWFLPCLLFVRVNGEGLLRLMENDVQGELANVEPNAGHWSLAAAVG